MTPSSQSPADDTQGSLLPEDEATAQAVRGSGSAPQQADRAVQAELAEQAAELQAKSSYLGGDPVAGLATDAASPTDLKGLPVEAEIRSDDDSKRS